MRFDGKVAFITGGGRGMGRATGLRFAQDGGDVVVADILEENAQSVAREIQELGRRSLPVRVDVTSYDEVKAAVKRAEEEMGKIDVLFNVAGWDKVGPFVETTPDLWEQIIGINLRGPINVTHCVLPGMMERGYGKIVSVASDSGRVGSTGEAVYSACKGGVIAFTKTIARETARHKINVNCVSPGPSDTHFFAELLEEKPRLGEALKKAIPWGRLGTPDDMANALCFLADDASEYITGQVLSVSGGLTMV
jgi:2-hydroxycyclohexanecarboxyl-CoA dehydrogenase